MEILIALLLCSLGFAVIDNIASSAAFIDSRAEWIAIYVIGAGLMFWIALVIIITY